MRLEELKLHKKHLKMQRYLCFAMVFVMSLNLNKSLNEKDSACEDVSDITIENSIETNLNSTNFLNVDNKVFTLDQECLAKTEKAPKPAMLYRTLESEEKELSYEEKMLAIMEREGYSYDELDAVCAGCVAESCGDPDCYDEAYSVASTFNNRTHSPEWVYSVSRVFGENTGYSIYYQFIAPGQFSVYSTGLYKKYLGRIDLIGYQAAIDMFYSGIPSHNYLNFNYIPDKKMPSYRLDSEGHCGNYYCNELLEEDRIDEEKVLELVLKIED